MVVFSLLSQSFFKTIFSVISFDKNCVVLRYARFFFKREQSRARFFMGFVLRRGFARARVCNTMVRALRSRWQVTVKDLRNDSVSRSSYDGVMVCVGHHAYPYHPVLPGLDQFRGSVHHTHDIKECDRFRGRRVLVVGAGNSGMDVATEASLHAEKVTRHFFLSTSALQQQ